MDSAYRQRQYDDYLRYAEAHSHETLRTLNSESVDVLGTLALSTMLVPIEYHTPRAEYAPARQDVVSLGHVALNELVSRERTEQPLDHPDQVLLGSRRSHYALAS